MNNDNLIPTDVTIKIESFMRNELKLKGIDLIVFAIIYGFTTIQNKWYTGGNVYLEKCTGASNKTIIESVKRLCAKGLIEKVSETTSDGEVVRTIVKHRCLYNSIKEQDIRKGKRKSQSERRPKTLTEHFVKTICLRKKYDDKETAFIVMVINKYYTFINYYKNQNQPFASIEALEPIVSVINEKLLFLEEEQVEDLIDEYIYEWDRYVSNGYTPTIYHFLSYGIIENYLERLGL